MRKFLSLALTVFLVAACQPEQQTDLETYPNAELLVEAEWLIDNLEAENLVIVDIRDEPEGDFIPGAVATGGIGYLIDDTHEVEHFLIGPDEFAEKMSRLGIGNETEVIVYDEGRSLGSVRLFHAMDYYGHDNIRILNGGLAAWKSIDGPLAEAPADPMTAGFTVRLNENAVCELNDLLAAIEDEDKIILDARSDEERSGEEVRAERGGHIPGSVHLEWSNMITDDEVPRFKPAREIESIFNEHGIDRDKEIITHCQSNTRGAHVYFVLKLMGYENIRAYEGSWSEYGNREDVPVSSLQTE